MVAIRDSLSDVASSDDGDDGDDEDDDETVQGQQSDNDQPGWEMGTISKMVTQCMERLLQKQTKFHELTQPGWEDAADSFPDEDML